MVFVWGMSPIKLLILAVCLGKKLVSANDILRTVIPRPPVEPGIVVSSPQQTRPIHQVKLEIFIDLNCPSSYEAYVRIIKPLADHYSTDNRLVILVHLYPLPYHRNSMLSTQGAFTVMELNPDKTLQYLEAVLQKWNELSTANTRSLSEYEVLRYITDIAVNSTKLSAGHFRDRIDTYRPHVQKVWKYGASRSVAATPTFFINGVQINLPDDSTLPMDKNLWIQYIDQVLAEMDDIVSH